jgi:hypothetical protein
MKRQAHKCKKQNKKISWSDNEVGEIILTRSEDILAYHWNIHIKYHWI